MKNDHFRDTTKPIEEGEVTAIDKFIAEELQPCFSLEAGKDNGRHVEVNKLRKFIKQQRQEAVREFTNKLLKRSHEVIDTINFKERVIVYERDILQALKSF